MTFISKKLTAKDKKYNNNYKSSFKLSIKRAENDLKNGRYRIMKSLNDLD